MGPRAERGHGHILLGLSQKQSPIDNNLQIKIYFHYLILLFKNTFMDKLMPSYSGEQKTNSMASVEVSCLAMSHHDISCFLII